MILRVGTQGSYMRNWVEREEQRALLSDACLPLVDNMAAALAGGASCLAGPGRASTWYRLRGLVVATGYHFKAYFALDDDSWGGRPWPPGAGCEAPRPFDRWVIANDSEVELVGPAGRLKDHIATAHSTAARPVILFYEAAPGVTREARTSVTLVARPAAEQAAPAAQRSTCRKMQVRAGWVVFVQGFAPGQGARTPVRVGACCCW
jgi:hypothetical protein